MADPLVTHLLQQSIEQNAQLSDPSTVELIVRLLQQSIEQNARILEEHVSIKASLSSHMLDEDRLVQSLVGAFPKKPDGSPDFEGHETFHTALIDEARERAAFFRGLRYKLLEKGFWGLLSVLALLIAYWWTGNVRVMP